MNLYRIYHQLLGADEREALARVEVADSDYLQVAADMQCSPQEVRRLVFEARRKLLLGMAPTLASLDDAPGG
jgi:DNA-directed RNA polymerase specialized sigma24 family protein